VSAAESPDAATDRTARPAPTKGTIALFVEPWADVYFRGRKIARAPIQKLRLPVGTHRLRLVNPVLGIKKSVTVTVPRKQPYRVILKPR
jgi:serine/threonine-protein kinase